MLVLVLQVIGTALWVGILAVDCYAGYCILQVGRSVYRGELRARTVFRGILGALAWLAISATFLVLTGAMVATFVEAGRVRDIELVLAVFAFPGLWGIAEWVFASCFTDKDEEVLDVDSLP